MSDAQRTSSRLTSVGPALAAMVLVTVSPAALATNGYQLIGFGAYQKGLAGAVTANPGSAMTAVTNPAGLARIPNRADFSLEAFMPDRSTDFSAVGGDKVDSDATMYGIPAIGWKAPVGSGDNMWFGGGMYATSGLGVDYAQTTLAPSPACGSECLYDAYSAIAFWQMAPALAWKLNDRLDVGAALHIDYQTVAFQQRVQDGAGATISNFDLSRAAQAFGVGVGFGFLYDVTGRVTVGAAYKSKQEFSPLEYNLGAGDIRSAPGSALPAGKYELDLDYPQQASIGAAFRATPAVTISADVKWIEWSDTLGQLSVRGPGGVEVPMDPRWIDQTVYALGVNWQVNGIVRVRAGYNYGKTPLQDEFVQRNFILPAVAERHVTVGGDFRLGRGWELGFHYMYAPEEEMEVKATSDDLFPGSVPTGTKIAMDQQSIGINIGYLLK